MSDQCRQVTAQGDAEPAGVWQLSGAVRAENEYCLVVIVGR